MWEAVKELIFCNNFLLDESDDVDNACLADLDLRLAYFPLNGHKQHSSQQLFC